MSLTNDG